MSSRIDSLRNLFLFTFFLLVISIIFTPLLVKAGFSLFPEEVLESILLFIQVSVAWKIFQLYEQTVSFREKETRKLEREYQKREKELLEAFAYLGKMNVQVSLIKSFLQKLKAPSNRKEAESYIREILKIVLSLSRKKWVTLRIIDKNTHKTLNEYWAYSSNSNPAAEVSGIKIGNKDIIRQEDGQMKDENREFRVFESSGSELSQSRFFLIFPKGSRTNPDIDDFLRAAANQCEVILTLFSLKERG